MKEQAALFAYDQGRSDKKYEAVEEQVALFGFACNQKAQTVPQGVFEKCLS